MNFETLNNLVVILIFSSLILLAFLSFTNPLKVNRKANMWFGFFLSVWFTFWMEEIIDITGFYIQNREVYFLIHYLQIFAPITFYLSIVYFTDPDFRLSYKSLKHLILPTLYLFAFIQSYYVGNNYKNIAEYAGISIVIFQMLFYSGFSFIKIRKHKKRILSFSSSTGDIDLNWLENIILLTLFIVLVIAYSNLFISSTSLSLPVNIIMLCVIYYIAFWLFKQKEIYPINENQRSELISIDEEIILKENKKKLVSDEDLIVLKSRLSELMKHEEPFLDSELNLIRLAELIELTPHQLSFVINTGFDENFYQFINKYRVQKAKELLLDNDKNKLTILALAYESGFNSKTSFNIAFKKLTSYTPSEFKKRSSTL